MPDDTRHRLEARVEGRVQGVGFRHFARTRAAALGLAGWVRNEPDGAVRVVAEGPRDALERFVQALHDGPPAGRVRAVDAAWQRAEGGFEGFTIRYR